MSVIELRVCGRYRLEGMLNRSHNHCTYTAVNVQTEEEVIIKAEEAKGRRDNPQSLLTEGKILQSLQGGIGIPSMHWCGQEEDYNFIVMEFLGRSLQEQLGRCGGKFSLKTTLMIGEQLVNILQYFHFKNLVHSDLSPARFLFGRGKKNNKMFMCNFSKTKRYRDNKTLELHPLIEGNLEHSNLLFSSINFHKGVKASRRDDMESILLMMIYFLKGLPWESVQGATLEERSLNILACKSSTPIKQLCAGLPSQFVALMTHVRCLKFEDKPDYTLLKNVFKQSMGKEGMLNDSIFDWVLLPVERTQLPVDYYPLRLEVIPNEEEFLRIHLAQYKKEEEPGLVSEIRENEPEAIVAGQKTPKGTKEGAKEKEKEKDKDKECLLF